MLNQSQALIKNLLGCSLLAIACGGCGAQSGAVPSTTSESATAEPATAELAKDKKLRDIDEALKIAQDSGRDVLVNFTGLSWCQFCILLERQVLSKPEFAAAAEHFVIVELDFPENLEGDGSTKDSNFPKAARQKYRTWQSKYLVPAFPTMVVMDARGVPLAYTGYEEGISPASLLKELEEIRQARIKRDLLLQQAEHQTGSERAASLDAALECIAPRMGTVKERNGDALLSWYGETIAEINRLDTDGKLNLQSKYKQRQQALQEFTDSEKVFEKLKKFKSSKDALAYVDKLLPTINDPEIALRLELARHFYLESDNQHTTALENARRLLERTDLTRDQRDHLKFRVAFNLKNLGQFTESAAEFDELIAANQDRPSEQLKFLANKAWFLHYGAEAGGDRGAAIKAFQDWRAHDKPGSDGWETATWGLSIQHQKAGEFPAALELRQELLKVEETPERLLDVAETYISLGQKPEAAKELAKAENLMASISKDPAADKSRAEQVATRTRDLKQRMNQAN